MQNEEWGWDQVEMVPSEKAKGFLTCSNCHRPLIEVYSWGAKNWKYCPCCGREFKRNGKQRD